jgi:hypothetical protein
MRVFSFDIRDEFDPVNGSTFGRFLRPDNPYVILCMACDHAGLASRAFIQINGHPPTMHQEPLSIYKNMPEYPPSSAGGMNGLPSPLEGEG